MQDRAVGTPVPESGSWPALCHFNPTNPRFQLWLHAEALGSQTGCSVGGQSRAVTVCIPTPMRGVPGLSCAHPPAQVQHLGLQSRSRAGQEGGRAWAGSAAVLAG